MKKLLFVLYALGFAGLLRAQEQVHWSVVLEQPSQPDAEVGSFDGLPDHALSFGKKIGDIQVDVKIDRKENLVVFEATASSESDTTCFLSLKSDFKAGVPYSYLGEVKGRQVFRQSPHDPGDPHLGELVKQAIPMLAIKDASGFTVAINDTPALYDNFTTQALDSQAQTAVLSSGDNGEVTGKPPENPAVQTHYHKIGAGQTHVFDGILFQSSAQNLSDLRKDLFGAVAKRWGDNVTGRFGATAFGSNYMLVRRNETGHSRYWVVPAMEYCDKQYSRDSFWQSMVLPPEYASQCYQNEAVAQSTGAERPLFCMIWAYRTKLEGGQPDMESARKTLKYIEAHAADGWYHSSSTKGKKDFQSWYDVVAFEEDDVITYNQGLLAVALLSAEALGLESKVSSAQAIQNYQSMFNEQGGYFPLSRQKDLLAMDPLVGDLLAQVYFNRALLSDESVRSHFQQIVAHAKTPHGFKVTCLPNGDYAPFEAYCAKDFVIPAKDLGSQGSYQWGGSWYLYDMLCLIDCELHGAPGAGDEVAWRGALDFKLGGTYFEAINTVTGEAGKANQGWDAAVYALWKKLMTQGRVDGSLLDAIDKV